MGDSNLPLDLKPRKEINLKHVVKMYEIAKQGVSGLLQKHNSEFKTKKENKDGKLQNVETSEKITEKEAIYRTWKEIKEVREFRKRLHNYLKKYTNETTKNIYSEQNSQHKKASKVTLQQACDAMLNFSENQEVKDFTQKHKNIKDVYVSRLELQIWNLKHPQ